MNIARRVTIGISTKDRWDELAKTIKMLVDLGLCDVPVIVVNDASAEAKADQVCGVLL